MNISIHAARVGCDGYRVDEQRVDKNFNPRSPSGLRQARAATIQQQVTISIHAARVGCDYPGYPPGEEPAEFQSTQPEWAATASVFYR